MFFFGLDRALILRVALKLTLFFEKVFSTLGRIGMRKFSIKPIQSMYETILDVGKPPFALDYTGNTKKKEQNQVIKNE